MTNTARLEYAAMFTLSYLLGLGVWAFVAARDIAQSRLPQPGGHRKIVAVAREHATATLN